VSMRAAGGRPTKEQAAARTEALLDTARGLFCIKGVAVTSIDEIAQVLRSSKHTIYRRYDSKLVLLEAVVSRDVDRFQIALKNAGAVEREPMATLRAMARTYFDFGSSRAYSALYAAIALEAATSDHLRARLRGWAAAALLPLRQAIVAAMPAQDWRNDNPDEVCEILVDLLDGAANRAKWSEDKEADQAALSRVFAARWEVFRYAMGAAADQREPSPTPTECASVVLAQSHPYAHPKEPRDHRRAELFHPDDAGMDRR
jgi:TetR/AcrR family transcriptional regulator, mexJK operon transcriptional repressor